MNAYRLLSLAAAVTWCAPANFVLAAETPTFPSNIAQPLGGAGNPVQPGYLIGPQDTLAIDVFHVPDLSRTVHVDAGGNIFLPLVGQVMAGGRTADQLSQDIATELNKKYLKEPIVTVAVTESSSQKVTVDGAVIQPGVYPISGDTTLMQAVALARGPDRIANISQVAIFRTVGNQRTSTVFDLSAIREGKATDPRVLPNDVIVVDTSGTRSFLRDLGDAFPIFSLLRPF